ncbi:MAG: response regulator [Desulfovibrionaceae bacterium]|nr:response regulator [Desulfovibrionaceae bacterium]
MRSELIKIMLVDDEIEVSRILAKRLTKRGFTCECAENGKICLEKMDSFLADVVIMDVKMPVMDGLETLPFLVDKYKNSKIILLSGHADMQIAIQAMSLGAFGYLMKPVDFDELLFKIEDALQQMELES